MAPIIKAIETVRGEKNFSSIISLNRKNYIIVKNDNNCSDMEQMSGCHGLTIGKFYKTKLYIWKTGLKWYNTNWHNLNNEN